MRIGFFPLAIMLQIVYQPEKIFPGGLQFHGLLVRNTHQLNTVAVKPAFHILILNAIHFELTIDPLKRFGIGIIRKMCGGNFYGNQFRFIILILIQLCLKAGT